MADQELREQLEQLRNATSLRDAERTLRQILAREAEACASLMVAGRLEDIHDSVLQRANQHHEMSLT